MGICCAKSINQDPNELNTEKRSESRSDKSNILKKLSNNKIDNENSLKNGESNIALDTNFDIKDNCSNNKTPLNNKSTIKIYNAINDSVSKEFNIGLTYDIPKEPNRIFLSFECVEANKLAEYT